jgi:prepilin-type N-terminal cleavage/methylation domain-containing protein/prepilin-type processing-associated H-X9-DG protein
MPRISFRRGFTLSELLVVTGLVAMLAALLLPVVSKARKCAQSTACTSNLRQLGTAWMMYASEHKGRMPEYVWVTPTTPDRAWEGYWPGIVETYGVRGAGLLCASAKEPSDRNRGYGNATTAWSGKLAAPGTAVKLNNETYRDGSYGYNRYLTAGSYGPDGTRVVSSSAIRHASETPLFMDCAYADTRPVNGSPAAPPGPMPPDPQGKTLTAGSPEHWKFLIARHGRGINVVMVDGSVHWVRLEDTYNLRWKMDWVRYTLSLPA